MSYPGLFPPCLFELSSGLVIFWAGGVRVGKTHP
jgi:hypothetical protein